VPRPPRRLDAVDPTAQVAVIDQAAGDGPTSTRLLALESRVAVSEKSTRALLVEVVRLQAALSTASQSADEDRVARRDAENRMRATADTLAQVGAQLEREEHRRRTEGDDARTLLATAKDAEAAALAARQEAAKRAEEQANGYHFRIMKKFLETKNIAQAICKAVMGKS